MDLLSAEHELTRDIAGDAQRLDRFARIRHRPFPGGHWLRTPALVLGTAWYRLRNLVA